MIRDIELAHVAYSCLHVAIINARMEGKTAVFVRDTNPYLIELVKDRIDNRCLIFTNDGFWVYI